MSGLTRYVRILRLFDATHGEWTITAISIALSLPTSTVYRTVRDMVAGGLLEAAGEAHYRLGCCFIEFDRIIRVTDPLFNAGGPLVRELVQQARVPCAATIARLYNDKVMCIADAVTPDGSVHSGYVRGQPRPLTRGATSKAILAQLPSRRLSRLLAQEAEEGGPGYAKRPEAELRQELQMIRKRGFSVTHGELDAGFSGIAAPVNLPAHRIVASLSLVVKAIGDAALERRLAMLVVSTAGLLMEQLAATSLPEDQPNKRMRSLNRS